MGFNSKIEWTTHTFNPWWGCTKVSDGCKFCYAELLSNRYGHDVWGAGKQRRLLSDKHWQEPLKWNARAQAEGVRYRVFCASMADVFEDDAPTSERNRLWEIIRRTPMLDWQLLTKRPERISVNLPDDWGVGYRNVWLGTSVEDERVLERIDYLVEVSATVHFLSLEPLIGPLSNLPLENIQWVIVGGESGPRARPVDEEWVLDIQAQCRIAGVPFFFKQWGGFNKARNGRELRGRFYDEMPYSTRRRQRVA